MAPEGTQEALCGTVDHRIVSWFIAEGLQTVVPGLPDLFKPGLGCLKDFELEVKFKPEARAARPIFCNPRPVPLTILEDLNDTYEDGVRKKVWKPTEFNAYRTPMGPVRKAVCPRQKRPGSESVGITQ